MGNLGFPVENALSRFSLGSRSALKENEDGSITIYIQHTKPDKSKQDNWLPVAENGLLGITMRIYGPNKEVLTGEWKPPAIEKVDKF